MGWRRDWLCWVLLGLAIGGPVVGLSPYWEESNDPATGDRVTDFTLGLAGSPAYRQTRREPPTGGYRITSRVGWLSWSALAVLVGVAALEGLRVRRASLRGERPPAG